MLAQLFQFVAQFWRALLPWVIREPEQVGFFRWLGVPTKRELRPGWNWKCPLAHTVELEDGRAYSYILDPQSVQTADDVALVLRLSVTCRVVDALAYFGNVFDGRSNIQDVACGELAEVVQAAPMADVLSGKVLAKLKKRVRARAREWGMAVDSIKLVDRARARSVRVWQSSFTSAGQD